MMYPAQKDPITLYPPRRMAVSPVPPKSSRFDFLPKLKFFLSALVVSGLTASLFFQADRVLGVLAQGGSAVTLDRVLDENFNLSLSGYLEGSQLKSTASAGAPLTVASSELVTNLNADLLDGQHGSYYLNWSNATSKPTILSSLDGVTNNLGNIDLVAGANITITPNDLAKTVTIAAAGATPSGWIDDGTVVRLDTATDSVGIGTASPAAGMKMTVDGGIRLRQDGLTRFRGDLIVSDFMPRIIAYDDGDAMHVPFVIESSQLRFLPVGSGNNGVYFGSAVGVHSFFNSTGSASLKLSTTAGTATVFNETAADLDFRIEGVSDSSLFFVDASTNRVGIGTSSPLGNLHVQSGSPGTVTPHVNADELVIVGSQKTGLSILGGDAYGHYIIFGSPASNVESIIQSSSGSFSIDRGGNSIMYFDDAADVMNFNAGALNFDFQVQGDNDVNLLYLNAGTDKVGIGTNSPGQKLEVNGGVRLNTATGKPTCDSTTRGTLWFTQSGAGVKDTLEVCAKDAGDAYAWRTLY